jgi:hypothetical protein
MPWKQEGKNKPATPQHQHHANPTPNTSYQQQQKHKTPNNTPPTGQMMPKRIQLKRIRGWRLPDNAVKISRPGKWGNPFVITDKVHPGHTNGGCYYAVPTLEDALACYQEYLEKRPDLKRDAVAELAGKDLACFCREGEPCHGDILIAVANGLEYKPYVATNDAEQYELPVMS